MYVVGLIFKFVLDGMSARVVIEKWTSIGRDNIVSRI